MSTTTPNVKPRSVPEPQTTARVETLSSGVIHGQCEDALRIVAGSDLPADDTDLVRFKPGDEEDATVYEVPLDPEKVISENNTATVVLTGVIEEHYATTGKPRHRASFQCPYEARKPFQAIRKESPINASFTNGQTPRWNVTLPNLMKAINGVLSGGFNFVVRVHLLRKLVDPHPEHTIEDSGEFIITDNALVDPDHYEPEESHPEKGHGLGGNPHEILYKLKSGVCPVDGCDAEFETFKELRGHIGGSATPNDSPEENAHDRVNLRLHTVDVASEERVQVEV